MSRFVLSLSDHEPAFAAAVAAPAMPKAFAHDLKCNTSAVVSRNYDARLVHHVSGLRRQVLHQELLKVFSPR
jgi:hypothetical protein